MTDNYNTPRELHDNYIMQRCFHADLSNTMTKYNYINLYVDHTELDGWHINFLFSESENYQI